MMKHFIIISIVIALVGCKVSGTITIDGVPAQGVTVLLSGDDNQTVTSDSNGNFEFEVNDVSANYTVTPSMANVSFEPLAKSVTINRSTPREGVSNVNFTGTLDCCTTWHNYYGGDRPAYGSSIKQTLDGGYVIAGQTSIGENYNMWLMKLGSKGEMVWEKNFGKEGYDIANDVLPTSDGGYIIAGFGHPNSSIPDGIIIKANGNGDIEWEKSYGGDGLDIINSINSTTDGGYIMTGSSESFGSGIRNIWLLKVDSAGDLEWQTTYGGADYDTGYKVQQTTDGGYILGGELGSHETIDGATSYYSKGIIYKVNPLGELQWYYKQQGSEIDRTRVSSLQQTEDGGYIVLLYGINTFSTNGLLKLDEIGDLQWQKNFTDNRNYYGESVLQANDGGYAVAGYVGAGGYDIKLLKTDSEGEIDWERYYGGDEFEYAYSVCQTDDGGYALTGYIHYINLQKNNEVLVIKTDEHGDVQY